MRAHENPYRISRVDTLPFRGPDPVARLAADLRSHAYRGAIVGPEGSGKSTLLRELADDLAAEGVRARLVRFDDAAVLATAVFDRHSVWLIDGAEQLATPIRTTLVRLVRRVVITSHTTTTGLPVLVRCETSPMLLEGLLAVLGGRPLPPGEAELLFRQHRGNLRLVFQALYETAAQDFVGAFRAR